MPVIPILPADRAVLAAEKRVRARPNDAAARDRLATLYVERALDFAREDLSDARRARDLSRAAKLAPHRADVHAAIGELCFVRCLEVRGVRAYTRALRLEPHNADYWRARAELFLRMSNWHAAIADLKRAIRYDERAQDHRELSTAYENMGDIPRALEALDTAISLDPENGWYHQSRSHLLWNARGIRAALPDAKRACELLPEETQPLEHYAVLLFKSGDYAGAVHALTRAIVLDPLDASTYSLRAVYRRYLGDDSGSDQDLLRAYELDPNNEPLPAYLARKMRRTRTLH